MKGVWMSVSTREGPAPNNGTGPEWLAGLARWIRTTSYCVLGEFSQPATIVPSGEMDVGLCPLALVVVSRAAVPVPSAACQYTFAAPVRVDENSRYLPSEVQTGSSSIAGSEVNRISVSLARSKIQ